MSQTCAEVSGKIESCDGWSLDRYPQLKNFLKNYEVFEYKDVEVEYVKGKKPILAIHIDGIETERILLEQYGSTEELHHLMTKKGFVRLSENEIREIKQKKRTEHENDPMEKYRQALGRRHAAMLAKQARMNGNKKKAAHEL